MNQAWHTLVTSGRPEGLWIFLLINIDNNHTFPPKVKDKWESNKGTAEMQKNHLLKQKLTLRNDLLHSELQTGTE